MPRKAGISRGREKVIGSREGRFGPSEPLCEAASGACAACGFAKHIHAGGQLVLGSNLRFPIPCSGSGRRLPGPRLLAAGHLGLFGGEPGAVGAELVVGPERAVQVDPAFDAAGFLDGELHVVVAGIEDLPELALDGAEGERLGLGVLAGATARNLSALEAVVEQRDST